MAGLNLINIFILFAFLQGNTRYGVHAAISCYDCNSNVNKDCFDTNAKTKTKNDCTYCRKIRQVLEGIGADDPVIERRCVDKNGDMIGYTSSTKTKPSMKCDIQDIPDSLVSHVCYCSSKNCNTAAPSPYHPRTVFGWMAAILIQTIIALLLAL